MDDWHNLWLRVAIHGACPLAYMLLHIIGTGTRNISTTTINHRRCDCHPRMHVSLTPNQGSLMKRFGWLLLLTLSPAPSAFAAVPTVNLSGTPTTIASGQSSKLSWSTFNATSCTASGGWNGAITGSGTQIVAPTAT